MAKKKHKKLKNSGEGKYIEYGPYDPTAPDANCIFCGSGSRYWVEYECGILQHRHPQVPVCKSCAWLLSQTSGGQYTIHTKAFDNQPELAQMKLDAVNAVKELLAEGRVQGTGHENTQLRKTPRRLERDIWHG